MCVSLLSSVPLALNAIACTRDGTQCLPVQLANRADIAAVHKFSAQCQTFALFRMLRGRSWNPAVVLSWGWGGVRGYVQMVRNGKTLLVPHLNRLSTPG